MEPEIIIGVLAIFVSGGAMGAAGTLLGQWVLKKISGPTPRQMSSANPREIELLKAEVADMATRLHSVDTRLDFTEQLLDGSLLGDSAPEPLPLAASSPVADPVDPAEPGGHSDRDDRSASSDAEGR